MLFLSTLVYAQNIDYNSAYHYYKIGLEHFQRKEYQKALNSFNKAIEIHPSLKDVYVFKGTCNTHLNNTSQAMQDYNKAISLDPISDFAYQSRGSLKSNLNDYRGALQDYNIAISLNPISNYYYIRGLIKIQSKDLDGACLDFSKAGELGYMEAYTAINDYCN